MAKKFNLADFVQPQRMSDPDTSELQEIPLSKLITNGRNIYGIRDVEELADSIAINGLLEPLIAYPYGDEAGSYRLLSGHRRLAALRMNEAETALCRIVPKPDSSAREDLLIIHANAQRKKTPAELMAEADKMTAALVALKNQGVELPGRVRDAVAEAMGLSPTALARKKVIQKQLTVPGFKAAYEAGKLGETAAYELARLPDGDQYRALDLLIDEGVNYEHADIKAVQRVKRRVQLGESPAQDLAAEAEKRGIQILGGDYSPLFGQLVLETLPGWLVTRVHACLTKAKGVEHLHDYGCGHSSLRGPGVVEHDCDPGGLTLVTPVGKRLKWPEVWELLMIARPRPEAEAARSVEDAGSYKGAEGEPETAPAGWRRCLDDPPEAGALVLVLDFFSDGDAAVDLCRFLDGQYCDPNNGDVGIYINKRRAWWIPSPAVTEEMRHEE